jgi:hypothetical protein
MKCGGRPFVSGIDTSGKSLPLWHHRKIQNARAGSPEAGFFVKFHALASFLPPYFRSPLGERFAGDLP